MRNFTDRTIVNINTGALRHNFAELSKNLAPTTRKMAVVKSNAYGHGIVECAKIFSECGADFLAVDCLEEALQLRENRIKTPILVLGFTPPADFAIAREKDISLTISTFESLEKALAEPKLKIHIKVDTGLHRQGFDFADLEKVLSQISQNENNTNSSEKTIIEGLYSHLAGAESKKFHKKTLEQIAKLKNWQESFHKNNLNPICHIGASAASMIYPESHFDMVRFGIALYGLWPSREIELLAQNIKLQPALSWQAVISEIKKVPKGECVGYDFSEKLKRDSTIGIIPIGYWHGLPRSLSKIGEVLVQNKKAKILGKVSMDMIIVDLTKIKNVKALDVATIIDSNKKDTEVGSVETIAKKAKTIGYEIITRINPLIPRNFL